MSESEQQSEADILAAMLDSINHKRAQITQVQRLMDSDDNKINSFKSLIADITKQMDAVVKEKNKRNEERYDLAKEARQEETALEALKRKMALEAEAKRQQEKQLTRRTTVDELTANAPWRDRAKPHQLDGMHYLSAAQRAICADEMGTGKTLQSIMWLRALIALGDSNGRGLVIAPGNLCDNFLLEAAKWEPDLICINLANLGTKGTFEELAMWDDMLAEGEEAIYLINYEILPRSKQIVEELIYRQFDSVILDEVHRIKDTAKSTYRAVEAIVLAHNTCPICQEVAIPTHPEGLSHQLKNSHMRVMCSAGHGEVTGERSVKNVLPMTGTIILNKPEEMYAALHLLHDDMFDTLSHFKDDYCSVDWQGKTRWAYGAESRLVNKIRGMYLRRTMLDTGIQLPPQEITVHKVTIEPPAYPKQRKILVDLATRAQVMIDKKEHETGKAIDFVSMLALLTRQRQASVWPGGISVDDIDEDGVPFRNHIGQHFLESAKLDLAVELYQEYCEEGGKRIVIFSQFVEPLLEMKRRIGDRAVVFSGDTPKEIREMIVRNFNRDSDEAPKWDVVLAQYRLGGEGLNLTACTQTIILDEQWNPGMNQQAYKRTQRMGQTEETGVQILRLDKSVKGAVDQWMAELIEQKRKIVDGFEQEVTVQQLEEVFKLSS